MPRNAIATYVQTQADWEGFYIDDESIYQNHTVNIGDIRSAVNDRDIAICEIQHRQVNTNRFNMNRLPSTLSQVTEFENLADEIEENYDEWTEIVRNAFSNHPEEYIMTDEMDEVFGFKNNEHKVILGMFSKISYRDERTPVGTEPMLELDSENSERGAGPAAYTLSGKP